MQSSLPLPMQMVATEGMLLLYRGHAVTPKISTGTDHSTGSYCEWHLSDSLNNHPEPLLTDNDRRKLQGRTLILQTGSVWDDLGSNSDLH
eukprot:1151918-Pelagomonas_calceolata.AAC.2